ncbi:formate dehydrogenase accessory sulfurtransferase FdhD [Labrys wisconsinensis]|nr:formate dehydrogenase accessory sulfurtransferase FdhD [Labrys wisconsinensis]
MPAGAQRIRRLSFRDGVAAEGSRAVPEETALAVVYDGGSYAVMMGSPTHLEDFAVGFSLTEGLIGGLDDIEDFETLEHENGIELRLWLKEPRSKALAARRRMIAGPTGCGLCGIDSLTEALRTPPRVGAGSRFTPAEIEAALAALAPAQVLNHETRAVHAAAFWSPDTGLAALREDVGRHNALDKLAGALARAGIEATRGLVLLTSRVSVEMVQKTATIGAPVIVAVSAPTALAVRTAEAAGITLIGVARGDGFEVFTHPDRIAPEPISHVA